MSRRALRRVRWSVYDATVIMATRTGWPLTNTPIYYCGVIQLRRQSAAAAAAIVVIYFISYRDAAMMINGY